MLFPFLPYQRHHKLLSCVSVSSSCSLVPVLLAFTHATPPSSSPWRLLWTRLASTTSPGKASHSLSPTPRHTHTSTHTQSRWNPPGKALNPLHRPLWTPVITLRSTFFLLFLVYLSSLGLEYYFVNVPHVSSRNVTEIALSQPVNQFRKKWCSHNVKFSHSGRRYDWSHGQGIIYICL